MKVNLSYSVELDEVLAAVERLYREARQKFEQSYGTLTTVSPPAFALGHLENTVRNIGTTQEALATFSAKLEEIQGILSGYQGLIHNHMEANLPPPPAPWPEGAPTEAAPSVPTDSEEESYADDD